MHINLQFTIRSHLIPQLWPTLPPGIMIWTAVLTQPPKPSETTKNPKKIPSLDRISRYLRLMISALYTRTVQNIVSGVGFSDFHFSEPNILYQPRVLRGLYKDYVVFWTERRKEYGWKLYNYSFINLNAKIYKTRWIWNNHKEVHHEI